MIAALAKTMMVSYVLTIVMWPHGVSQFEREEMYARMRANESTRWICAFAKEWKWKMHMAAPHADRKLDETARFCGFADD